MKIYIFTCSLLFISSVAMAQPGASFYPHHRGDVWQYRWVSTGQIARTRYLDSLRVDSLSRDTYLYFRPLGTGARERVDSLQNVFNLNFQENYPRYKLAADSGASWVAGYEIYGGDTLSTTRVTISRIYPSVVFGVPTTVKVFRFDRTITGGGTFWLGNDHLAEGFGVVQEDIEPSDVQYLSGAIINGVQYGIIMHASEGESLPKGFHLFQNYPNPFNPSTTIRFTLHNSHFITLKVFDVLGRELATLVNEVRWPGEHSIQFDASGLAGGTYIYTLKTQKGSLSKRMLLIK